MAPPDRVRREIRLVVETPRLGARPDEHDGALVSLVLSTLPTGWRLEAITTAIVHTASPWPLRDDDRAPESGPDRALDQPESDATGPGWGSPPGEAQAST